jgi:hypothetical protein
MYLAMNNGPRGRRNPRRASRLVADSGGGAEP